jgi:hypothetical protein
MLLSPTSPIGTRSLALLSLMLGAASICGAGPITYNVNLTIGPGNVTGFIETDGMIGTLAETNIVNYNLLLSDPNPKNTFGPADLNCSFACNFFGFSGSDLSATPTELLFNFSGTDAGGFAISDPSLNFSVGFSALGGGEFFHFNGFSLGLGFNDNYSTSLSGTQVIGTAAPSSVPEPSTLGLTGTSVALMGALLWFRGGGASQVKILRRI